VVEAFVNLIILTTFNQWRELVAKSTTSCRRTMSQLGQLGLVFLLLAPSLTSADCRAVTATHAVSAESGHFGRGLLWKIAAPGAEPSYLFGTMHSNDPRIRQLPCPVQDALDSTSDYTMEMIVNGAVFVSMAEVMFLSEGKTLRSIVGEGLYREIAEAFDENGQSIPGLDHMKPWAIVMMLSTPREQSGLFLDLALMRDAVRANKATFGLESAREQFDAFDGLEVGDQVSLLRDTLRSRKKMAETMNELTAAYLDRDLNALVRLSEKVRPSDDRAYKRLMDRLLDQRNVNMAKRMEPRLKEGKAFIAVGALHLPGDNGLLRLLTNAGYSVSAVY